MGTPLPSQRKGDEERPREGTRTLIEFTDKGQVIFNRMDKDNSDKMKSQTGKYALDNNGITITDDAGNTVKWPYQADGRHSCNNYAGEEQRSSSGGAFDSVYC